MIPVELGVAQQTERQREIAVEIDRQLVSPETNTHLVMERPFVFTLPPLGELQIHGHDFGFDGQQGWIRVRTSQEVDAEAVKRSVRLEPVRPYAIQTDNGGFTLRGEFRPGEAYRLSVAVDWRACSAGRPGTHTTPTSSSGTSSRRSGSPRSPGPICCWAGRSSSRSGPRTSPKLAVRVSQVFQNNLVYFLDEGRYYDYYYDDYSEEQEGERPRRKFRYVVRNFGRQLDYDTLEIASAPNREVSTWLSLERFLNNGYKGFSSSNSRIRPRPGARPAKLVVLSDIGLVVKRSDDELMVFATSLASTKPLRGSRSRSSPRTTR